VLSSADSAAKVLIRAAALSTSARVRASGVVAM
jgi:hypothetical protein